MGPSCQWTWMKYTYRRMEKLSSTDHPVLFQISEYQQADWRHLSGLLCQGFLRLGSFEGLQGSIVYPSSDSLHLHVLFCFRLIPGDKLVFWNLFLISHLSKILIEMKFKTIGYYNQNLPIQVVSLQPPSQLVLWPVEKSLRNVFLALFFCICPQPRRLWPVLSSWRWNGNKKIQVHFLP